ncbi:MAG TPA: TonB-dependent receptor [Opitutaceae bacterium]|nr:TonB-dependent receptor [Opitutaceae bacterium]
MTSNLHLPSGGPARLAAALVALAAAPLSAQQANPPPAAANETPVALHEYVVTGVRASLISAQEIKRESVQLVDSIVAEDIGKLPDNTVADALQRVPGIQVARDNGEVNSVVIRGLPNLGTTLNGHEIFTGTARGVALQDIPAELVAGVDVYKTTAPHMIEGGIAGVIDIRLRRPFDFEGAALTASGRYINGDNADDDSWIGSALASHRWKSSAGEFGALVAVSDQRYNFKDQRVFNFLWEPVPSGGVVSSPTIDLPVTAGSLLIPGERERPAVSFSAQWRPNENLELYADLLYTGYRNKRAVHFFIGFPRFGAFTSATLTPNSTAGDTVTSTNNFHLNSTQAFSDKTDGYQFAAGAKWRRGKVKASTDFVYNWNSFKNRVVIVDVQYVAPSTFTFDLNTPHGTSVAITGGDLRNAANYRLWGLFDNHGYATSEQTSWQADAEYALDGSFFGSLKGGIRVSERDARSRQTAVNDVPPVGGRGVVSTATIPGFGSLAPDGLFSSADFPASNWYAGDPDFLRDNVGTIRQLFGRPVTDPNFDPTQSFTDSEQVYAAYVQAAYQTDVGDWPLDGTIGLRVSNTQQDLQGNLANGTPVDAGTDETDVLPVLNGRLKLKENLLFRYSAGRSITRPNFADLDPVATLNAPTTTGGAAGTGSGGNPDLQPVKSDNYDLALEYYFAEASFVSVAAFYRRIDGYVQTFASNETIGGVNYIVTRPRNSGVGHLEGFEVSYQHFPSALPEALRGFGWQANYTYIDGETDTADTSPGAPVGARATRPYAQVSRDSYNLVAIYERGPFSARLAYNWRGEFVDTFDGPNAAGSPLRTIRVKPTDRLDFSASYKWGRHLTFTLDATNLLDSEYEDYFGPTAGVYPRDYRLFDRTIEFGVRYRY